MGQDPPICWVLALPPALLTCRLRSGVGASCLLVAWQGVEEGVDEVTLRGEEVTLAVTVVTTSPTSALTDALHGSLTPTLLAFPAPSPPLGRQQPAPLHWDPPQLRTSATSGAAWMRCQM